MMWWISLGSRNSDPSQDGCRRAAALALASALALVGCSVGERLDPKPPSPSSGEQPAAAAEPAKKVAITIDDIGFARSVGSTDVQKAIAASLRQASAPVAVFFNCRELDDDMVALWRDFGATFGNHTATHRDVDDAIQPGSTQDPWWDDVRSCHERLARQLGESVRYFRFPYLRYGRTPERHAEAGRKLASLGYQVAHVTAATSEWLLARYYSAALEARDASLAGEIASEYVAHMVETLRAARELTLAKTGAEAVQITLLHGNRLAADHLGRVLEAWRKDGWQFVPLAEALADPLYARTDAYVGRCGCSWLARIEPALRPQDPYVFGDLESAIEIRYESRKPSSAER